MCVCCSAVLEVIGVCVLQCCARGDRCVCVCCSAVLEVIGVCVCVAVQC